MASGPAWPRSTGAPSRRGYDEGTGLLWKTLEPDFSEGLRELGNQDLSSENTGPQNSASPPVRGVVTGGQQSDLVI